MIPTPLQRLAVIAVAVSLAACGGGGGDATTSAAPAPSNGAQTASGTITGFGSVIVDGVKYDDSAAVVKVEDDSGAPRTVSVADLKLGMQVEVRADDAGRASTVTVQSEVKGRIESLVAGGFVVAGQTVRESTDTAAPTAYEGVANLAGLAVGDFVEVHGVRDADRIIVATRIEREDASATPRVRVVGPVEKLDLAKKTFMLGTLTVTWTDATRLLPAGATLADGLRVAVWSDVAPVGNTLAAKSIVIKRAEAPNTARAAVAGLVRGLDFAKKTFRIGEFDVDASAAAFSKGTANDLANGRRLRVRGTLVDGVLKATDVRFVKDQGDATVELTGVVTDFAGTAFKVRGVPIDVSGSGVQYSNGAQANLANGVLVRIEGDVAGNVVKPREIKFVTSEDDRARWLFGTVQGYQAQAGTFRLMGLEAKLTDATTFRNGDSTPATRADFGNDDRVQLRGAFVSGVFVVSEVVFRPGLQLVVDGVEGTAYEVDLTAGVFKLNGSVVRIGSTTVFEGSRENLRSGAKVEVTGTVVAGELVASKIEIESAGGGTVSGVRGTIGDFVSVSNFTVAGQRVDASAAVVEPAGATLAAGRYVEIKGPVTDGVLKATKLEVR